MVETETMSYAPVPEEARKSFSERLNPRNWKRKNKILTGLVAAVLGIGTCTNKDVKHESGYAVSIGISYDSLITGIEDKADTVFYKTKSNEFEALGAPDGNYAVLNFSPRVGKKRIVLEFEKPVRKLTFYIGPVNANSPLYLNPAVEEIQAGGKIKLRYLNSLIVLPNKNCSSYTYDLGRRSFTNRVIIENFGPAIDGLIDAVKNE